jgi:hypothetical protein
MIKTQGLDSVAGKNSRSFFICPGLFLILLLFAVNSSLFGLDLIIRPKGFVYIPSDDVKSVGGNAMYGIGGGGDIGFEIDLSSIWPNPVGIGYTLGVEGGMLFNSIQGDEEKSLSIYSAGGGVGLYCFPVSRLLVRLDGSIGAYIPSLDGNSGDIGMYWRGGGELGFRFTPDFTIAANAGWRQYHLSDNGIFNMGLYVGLTAQFSVQTGNNASRETVGVNFDQYESVYPAFMQLYQKNAIGSLVIRNNENAEIRDVRVSFRASPYTASEFPCGTIPFVARGRSVEVPLLADFSAEILRFTDKGRILGEVVIRYKFLGKEREVARSVILAANNRNMVTDGDIVALAAFISPTSPDTVDYAKFIAGLSRNDRRIGHNPNFQYAIWLIEGLKAGGVIYGKTYSDKTEAQFPAETLSFRSGNSKDLALLVAGCLESVGIPAAFIQTENDFLVAVSLNINASAAETLFSSSGFNSVKVLIIDDRVWLPLSMTAFNDGFTATWAKAVTVLADNFRAGKTAEFVIIEDAWAVYPPAPFPEQGGRAVRTDAAVAGREVNRAMQQYISGEIQPLLNQVQTRVSAAPTAALHNRLGILQIRAGRIADGKASYERAAGMGSVPAMTNRGNLALSEKDYATAERWFRQALSKDAKNAAALRGLEQIAEYK